MRLDAARDMDRLPRAGIEVEVLEVEVLEIKVLRNLLRHGASHSQ